MRRDDAREQFITRRVYDLLVDRHPIFMTTTWNHFRRQWSIGGVWVFGCAGSGLADMLNTIEQE